MPPIIGLLVSLTIFTVMFALGLGLRGSTFALSRHQPAVLGRILIGTCLLVPLAGLLLLELPLAAKLSVPVRFAIALMVICPSAPLALRRTSSPERASGLAARIQVSAALVAILSIPLLAGLFTLVRPVSGWDIRPLDIALQVTRVQLIPLAAGLLVKTWRPGWAERWTSTINKVATALLMVMVVVLLAITAGQLIPFLSQNLFGLLVMTAMVAISLGIGYGLAGPDPKERPTVALVTSTRNLGLAAQLAVVYGASIKGLIPAVLSYTLISTIVSIIVLKLLAARVSMEQPKSRAG
ncbi:sodium dependent transporter [Synechococcus sp. CBW1107]|uniref:bile acid:sodium symporter family protein n=1 Tax=Synechococcus sp. CBW1107 TaxID=2789857 RepID=UPI002AD3F478|nr:sodium dependent transporter [Synechococcus sp. CBW1107]CAK6701506.1 hypothetical protein IFHNHDMJ_03128 [Synechococcus sp. CBW1107]